LHYGDEVTVNRADITDWKYLDNGRLIGGFTMHAMAGDVGPMEAREYGLPDDTP
jgi:uncharacterized protein YegJ (DUF2314 family)